MNGLSNIGMRGARKDAPRIDYAYCLRRQVTALPS